MVLITPQPLPHAGAEAAWVDPRALPGWLDLKVETLPTSEC